ncbi:lysozyme [Enterococcus larvae]|uniref:lysozyme n=1 Tax=Enterococcus larvae TaxID=2794352 RepID=UPI001FD78962|nr:lysozyme [Enterococcus larvae]
MANENMKISQKGRDLIKEFEGLRLTAYQDSVGVWTIGYGHTKGVYAGMTISEQQANQFLDEDIRTHAYGIYNYVQVQLNQNQFDALASFHFNLGPYILSGSTLLVYINSSNWKDAASEMKKYVKAGGQTLPGLVRRREAEAELFLKGESLGEWVIQKTWSGIEIGIWDYYTVAHTLQWKYYNVDTKQWHFIQKGKSNWITLEVPKGNYWAHVEVLNSNNQIIDSKTMGTDGASNSVINAVNVSRESNGEFLLGVTSNNPHMSYVIKLYNYKTEKWFTQYNSQWARFKPENGVKYGVQFEIYGWDRRLDYQMHTFNG